jgi:PGF-CTERM protein
MNVTDAAIELEETDDSRFGVVNLSVTYVGLAAVEDGTLTVTDPFASGFEPDRQFVVTAPDGYTVDSATPAADTGAEARVVYDAGTDLSGFELVVEEAATPTGTPTDTEAEDGGDSDETPGGTTTGGQPGFGAAAAIVALAGAALLSLRRR